MTIGNPFKRQPLYMYATYQSRKSKKREVEDAKSHLPNLADAIALNYKVGRSS